MTSETAIEMFVGGLVLDPHTQAPVIVLKDESGDICLPIWIGVAEATSIASAIKQLNMARPLTHDLMHQLFGEVGVKLERVVITDLKESTYFAELVLSHGDKALIIDSRPSDAIALAVRSSAPIFVVQHVLDQAKMSISLASQGEGEGEKGSGAQGQDEPPSGGEAQPGRDFSQIEKEKWEDILKELDPDDFKYKM